MTTIIINLVGKSASGKNFHKSRFLCSTNENIVNLLKKHPVIRIVSTTTRAIRPGEVKGEDYHYISVEEHMRLRNEGQIFEEVSLGTTKYSHCKSELKKLKSGGVGILETNPEGTRQIIKYLSGVKILSFGFDVDEETQRKRMKSRDASISEEEITTRINVNKEFDEIFKEKDLFEHIYLNDEEKENFPVDLYNSLNDILQ